MPSDRRAILQLLANGRIDPAQAERLMILVSQERETVWALAGCVGIAAVMQIHGLLPGLLSLCQAALAGALPGLQHVLTSIAFLLGGRL
ncbi:MAG TPA: hypothetical protein VLZ50_13550 [Terracidiphilus sp.]|nr:hypothetical protein [Terracidiphilus sp.]